MTVEPRPSPVRTRSTLRSLALAAIASQIPGDSAEASEIRFLADHRQLVAADTRSWPKLLAHAVRRPLPADRALVQLGSEFGMNRVELLAVALALSVESDLMTGRALARAQTPLGGSRPTMGLVAAAFAEAAPRGIEPLQAILTGVALQTGLLTLMNEGAPIAERQMSVPLALCQALAGFDSSWPGTVLGLGPIPAVPLPNSVREKAAGQARQLGQEPLALRCGSVAEGRSVAAAVAEALELRPLFLENSPQTAGLVPWMALRRLLPVFCFDLGPGDRKSIPPLPQYRGPVLALAGPDGAIESAGEAVRSWTLTVPSREERRMLWSIALGDDDLAAHLSENYRHGSGRIAHLGRLVRQGSALRGVSQPAHDDVVQAAWTAEGSGLDALAQPLRTAIPDEALVTTPALARELERLLLRCRSRDGLADGLGPSAATRYQPGVRALFVGPSGTGKTLAAGWLATRLGLPLYRVDLSAVTSKYIGETEKNLAQLLARAEHAEVLLLFDEADSLFAKRTEVREANDRFANAQTNYLLQRLETFDGITILTSNSRARFDSAFARRLDAIVEFPPPGPEEQRKLWQSHLGEQHALSQRDLNRLAAAAELCGGNIRNLVLAAAVEARAAGRPIRYSDIAESLAGEFRKLNRQVPPELMD